MARLEGFLAWIPLISAVGVLGGTIFWYWGFLQDDVFISLRYAQNLANGHGLVFNPGERVEGFTNFSWTILAAVVMKFGGPALLVLRLTGAFSGGFLVILVWFHAGGKKWRETPSAALAAGFAALIVASNTTLAAWSASGLEETTFTLLIFLGYVFFANGKFEWASLVWLCSVLTRPEGLLALVLGFIVFCFSRLIAKKRFAKQEIAIVLISLVVLFFFILGRYLYYGKLVPNTFFVKGVSNWESHYRGLGDLGKFLRFNFNGLFLALASLSLGFHWFHRKRIVDTPFLGEEILFSALFVIGYLYYMVRISGEFLPFFRLYMPVLPFISLWAGLFINCIYPPPCSAKSEDSREKSMSTPIWRQLPGGLCAILILFAVSECIQTSLKHVEFQGVFSSLKSCHGSVGLYLEEQHLRFNRKKPLTVIAQDMGYTPFSAPSVRFVDVIGLTDTAIAQILYENGYTPYIRYLKWEDSAKREQIFQMEEKIRAYLGRQNADYVIFNIDVPWKEIDQLREALAVLDSDYLLPKAQANAFYYGLAATEEFKNKYKLVAAFPYSTVHAILLFGNLDATN